MLIKLKICWYLLFDSKSERIMQYLCNRMRPNITPFYHSDRRLLNDLIKFKRDGCTYDTKE